MKPKAGTIIELELGRCAFHECLDYAIPLQHTNSIAAVLTQPLTHTIPNEPLDSTYNNQNHETQASHHTHQSTRLRLAKHNHVFTFRNQHAIHHTIRST